MTSGVLILRPQPGADQTAERVRDAGLEPLIWPLFEIRVQSWRIPDQHGATAILLTSANAVRFLGEVSNDILSLSAYCVGAATAEVARRAGFNVRHIGARDAQAVVTVMVQDGHRAALHFRGRDTTPLHTDMHIIPITTYAAAVSDKGLPSAEILSRHITLLHSLRAARRFAELVHASGFDRASMRLVAISAGVADAAGAGWRAIALAKTPNDAAMIEAARCLTGG